MDINTALENYRSAMVGIWENLSKAGITPGDDEWDDITEVLYSCLVDTALDIETGHYAFYSANGESQNRIRLVISDGQDILLGKETIDENGITITINWENTKYKNDTQFEFREFSHVWENESISSLNYVIGQAPKENILVCVAHDKVSFQL